MGSIISSHVKEDGRVVFEVVVDADEALQLRGNINDVHIFSENVADISARLLQRGKKEATKYFLVPRELRKDLIIPRKVYCQRIETKTKTIFIYVMENY